MEVEIKNQKVHECEKAVDNLINCFANIDKSLSQHNCLTEINSFVNCKKENEKK